MPNGYVSQIQINDGDVQNIGSCAYAVCDTLEDVVEKVVSFPNFVLKTGATIHVKFTYRNTAFNPKLNVNGTGAKSIVMNTNNNFDSSLNLDSQYNVDQTWMAGAVMTLTYADSCWIINNPSRITTPYTYNISTGGTLEVDSYIVLADLEWELCTGSSNVTARVFPFRICMSTMVDGIYRDRSAIMEVFVGGCYNKKDYVDIMISDESEYHADSSYVFRSLVDSIFVYFEYEVESGNVIGKRTGHLLGKVPSSWSTFQLVPLTDMSVASADPDNTHHFLKFDIAHSSSSFEPSAGYETSIPSGNTLPTTVGVHKYLIKARLKPFDIGQLSGDGSTAGQYLKSNGSGNAPSWETMDSSPTANSTKAVTSGGVKTALDAKQNAITVTTNTSTPADNDTIIMQADGVSNTTTFIRRKLSYLWNWIKTKGDQRFWSKAFFEINFSEYNIFGYKTKIISPMSENALYAADLCGAVVEWKTYNENDEVILDKSSEVYKLFQGNIENINAHPLTGEYDILTIDMTSMTDVVSKIGEGFIMLYFRGSSPASIPELSIMRNNQNLWVAVTGTEGIKLGSRYLTYTYTIEYGDVRKIKVKVVGKSGTESSPNYNGSHIGVITYWRNRGLLRMKPIVTKYPVKQDLYGDVEAPKFIMRGGTNKQVLLANGTVATLPLSIANGGTGASTAKNAEYNLITNRTTELTTAIDDNKKISFFNENPSTSIGVFAGYRKALAFWTYIKSKADLIYSTITETNKKANRVIDHTWNQPSYSASAGGTHVKICDIPSDCVCVMNVRKSVYGYPSINTLWIGNNNSLDFKSLTETDIVATVSSRVCTLSVPAHTSSGTPLHTYDFEISVLNKENLSAITWYDDATYYSPSRPTKPNIVMQQSAPVTDGSLAFNVNSSTHVASVSVDGYTDFVGMLTEDSTSAVLVKLSDEAEGSVYRFTFDHAIEGGVSFSNSNASTVYCEVSQDIHAGDTITLTAVSNTSDGWIASVSSAGIISSDNSVNIEWENGVADLKVEGIPFNNIVNKAMFAEGDSPNPLAIGYGANSIIYTGNSEYPYAYAYTGNARKFSVNGDSDVYYKQVTAGTTYAITVNGISVNYTPSRNGSMLVLYSGIPSFLKDPLWAGDATHQWSVGFYTNASSTSSSRFSSLLQEYMRIDNYSVIILLGTGLSLSNITEHNFISYYGGSNALLPQVSIGHGAYANGENAIALGESAKALSYKSICIGESTTYERDTISIGNQNSNTQEYGIAIGTSVKIRLTDSSRTGGIAIGANSQCIGGYSVALGYYSSAKSYGVAVGTMADCASSGVAVGYNTKNKASSGVSLGHFCTNYGDNSIAIGSSTISSGNYSISIGYDARNIYYSNSKNYDTQRFGGTSFSEGGVSKVYLSATYGVDVTITYGGTTVTLTPPNANLTKLIVVNNAKAATIYKALSGYATINGSTVYIGNITQNNMQSVLITGNVYAIWFRGDSGIPSQVDSISFIAYYETDSQIGASQIAIGQRAYSIKGGAIVIGKDSIATRNGQIILGNYILPDDDAMFIVSGDGSSNTRKNILTIDSKERVHARAYISDPQTYDNGGNSVNLGTITMGILKVTGGGSITFTNQNAVEGHCVKVYASGSDITCNGDSITAGKWREYLFLDGAWRSKM